MEWAQVARRCTAGFPAGNGTFAMEPVVFRTYLYIQMNSVPKKSPVISSYRLSPNGKSKHGRATITNHVDVLPHITDHRQAQARRFRDLVRALIADAGGIEACSEVKVGLVRRLAAATVLSEDLEGRALSGEFISISEFCTLASTAVRLAQRVGVERRMKEIIQNPLQYAADGDAES